MSFKAVLEVGGEKYNVLSTSYQLYQETDATGRPSSISRGGSILFEVESTSSTKISDWAFGSFMQQSGSVKFLKRDTDATSKELKFENAYLVKFKEEFDSTGKNPMIQKFTLSAEKISVGTAEYVNEWV